MLSCSKTRIITFFLVALTSLPLYAKGRDPLTFSLPELQVINGAQHQWVGRHMARNGMPMSIRMFTYSGSLEQVKAFYTKLFKGMGNGALTASEVGYYQVIAYELRGIVYSVQFRPYKGGVEGKIVVSPVPSRFRFSVKTEFPLDKRCKTGSKVESLDLGKRSETLTLECRTSPVRLVDFYQSELKRLGWSLVSNRAVTKGAILDFQKGAELVQINITQFQKSDRRSAQVLIHWLKPA